MGIYNGFSARQFTNRKSFRLTDAEVIKEDLLNNIYTRRGERVKMFNYGTRIPDLIFEPLDDATIYMISDDLTGVFANDPRVQVNDMQIIPLYDQNAIAVYVDLFYTYLNFSDELSINIQFASSGT